MCCLHWTQFHIKLPPHLTDTTHMLSPIWIQLDFFLFVKQSGNMLNRGGKQGVYKLVQKYDIYPVS